MGWIWIEGMGIDDQKEIKDDEKINRMDWKNMEEGILRFVLISEDLGCRWTKAQIGISVKLKLGLD